MLIGLIEALSGTGEASAAPPRRGLPPPEPVSPVLARRCRCRAGDFRGVGAAASPLYLRLVAALSWRERCLCRLPCRRLCLCGVLTRSASLEEASAPSTARRNCSDRCVPKLTAAGTELSPMPAATAASTPWATYRKRICCACGNWLRARGNVTRMRYAAPGCNTGVSLPRRSALEAYTSLTPSQLVLSYVCEY